jgi:hypothetical protein
MTRILGPSGSGRRRRSLFGALASFLLLSLMILPSAFAVHDEGVFQLDGNAKKSDTTNAVDADPDPVTTDYGDDWDNVCAEVVGSANAAATCSTTVETDGATAVSWVSEPDRSSSIFTGGGSKDPQDLSNWLWKNAGGLPDKDNLRHAFAARYSETDDLLYFGSDRFDNSGDAVQGFWFLQAPLVADGASSGGGFKFTDGSGGTPAHTEGDLLVISDFSNGGQVSTINIYEWVPSGGDTTEHLSFVDGGTNALCAPPLSGDNFCGIVNPANQSPTASPWAFLDKSGSTSFLNGEFFEAGINLTGLGFADECFSTVVSETRASTSPTATLKDFVVGQFGDCVATLSTQVSDAGPVTPGTAVHDTLTVQSSDTTHTATGTVTWFLCGPIATGACDGVTNVGNSIGTSALGGSGGTATAVSPDVNTGTGLSPGRYCFRAEWPGDENFDDGPYSEFGGADGTNECFTVKDTSAITTAQSWLPQDSATVTTAGGTPVAGTVVFSLYETVDCTGPAATFTDTSAPFETNNTTYRTTSTVISWSATFTPSDPDAVAGSTTTRCEMSDLTIDNSASPFPPGP